MNQRYFILNHSFTQQLLMQFNSPETIRNKEIEIINAWFKKTFNQTFDTYSPAVIADPTKDIQLQFTKEQIETLNLYKYVQKSQFTKKNNLIESKPFIALNSQNDYVRKLKADFNSFVIKYIIENNIFSTFNNNYKKLSITLLKTIRPNGPRNIYHNVHKLKDNFLIYIINHQIYIYVKPKNHFIPDWLIEEELTKYEFNNLTKTHTPLSI